MKNDSDFVEWIDYYMNKIFTSYSSRCLDSLRSGMSYAHAELYVGSDQRIQTGWSASTGAPNAIRELGKSSFKTAGDAYREFCLKHMDFSLEDELLEMFDTNEKTERENQNAVKKYEKNFQYKGV